MKGLVLKDLLVLKTSLKTVVLIVILFGFMGAISGSTYMTTFAAVYAGILPMTSMAYDERCSFNRYAMAMPVKKGHIALSKYITGLLLTVAAMVIAVAMSVVAGGGSVAEIALVSLCVPLFYHSFMLPLMFKYGVEKSRIFILVGVVVPALLMAVAGETKVIMAITAKLGGLSDGVIIACLAAAVVVIYTASVFLSVHICKNKEW